MSTALNQKWLLVTPLLAFTACGLEPKENFRTPLSKITQKSTDSSGASCSDEPTIKPVLPILSQNCLSCHNSDTASGGWSFDQLDPKNPGGLTREKAWGQILDAMQTERMPPEGFNPVSAQQKDVFSEWVGAGHKVDCKPEETNGASLLASCDPQQTKAAPRRLWRVSHSQYGATTRNLLGMEHNEESRFGSDPRMFGFDNFSDSLRVSTVLVGRYRNAAKTLSQNLGSTRFKNLRDQFDPAQIGPRAFIQNFGRVLYRRELSERQINDLVGIHAAGVPDNIGYKLVLEAMLQSPYFLYRRELGNPNEEAQGVTTLTNYEIISLLSFTVWNQGPDQSLIKLAQQGGLTDGGKFDKVLLHILQDERAATYYQRLFGMLLEVDGLPEQTKDKNLFPSYSPEMMRAMLAEFNQIIGSAAIEDGATLSSLFEESRYFVTDQLNEVYDVGGSFGSTATRTSIDGRSGILNSAAFLAASSNTSDSNPFHRGKLMRERLLCTPLGSPPANIPPLPSMPKDEDLTRREHFEAHSSDPSCRGCHALIDDPGFSFDNFDAFGGAVARSTAETGGRLGQLIDAPIEFKDSGDMSRSLVQSEHFAECMTIQLFRYTYGREEKTSDACAMQDGHAAAQSDNGSLQSLLKELLLQPTALQRRFTNGEN